MSYEELLEEYGQEYLREYNRGEYALNDMGEFEYLEFEGRDLEPMEIWEMAMHAYGYTTGDPNSKKVEWSWSDDYYFYDGYGHLCSINSNQLQDFYSYHIDYYSFIEWCQEMGYAEGEIEE